MEQIFINQLTHLQVVQSSIIIKANPKTITRLATQISKLLTQYGPLLTLQQEPDFTLSTEKVLLVGCYSYNNLTQHRQNLYSGAYTPIILEFVITLFLNKVKFSKRQEDFTPFSFRLKPLVKIETKNTYKQRKHKLRPKPNEGKMRQTREGYNQLRKISQSRSDQKNTSRDQEYHGRKCYCCSHIQDSEQQSLSHQPKFHKSPHYKHQPSNFLSTHNRQASNNTYEQFFQRSLQQRAGGNSTQKQTEFVRKSQSPLVKFSHSKKPQINVNKGVVNLKNSEQLSRKAQQVKAFNARKLQQSSTSPSFYSNQMQNLMKTRRSKDFHIRSPTYEEKHFVNPKIKREKQAKSAQRSGVATTIPGHRKSKHYFKDKNQAFQIKQNQCKQDDEEFHINELKFPQINSAFQEANDTNQIQVIQRYSQISAPPHELRQYSEKHIFLGDNKIESKKLSKKDSVYQRGYSKGLGQKWQTQLNSQRTPQNVYQKEQKLRENLQIPFKIPEEQPHQANKGQKKSQNPTNRIKKIPKAQQKEKVRQINQKSKIINSRKQLQSKTRDQHSKKDNAPLNKERVASQEAKQSQKLNPYLQQEVKHEHDSSYQTKRTNKGYTEQKRLTENVQTQKKKKLSAGDMQPCEATKAANMEQNQAINARLEKQQSKKAHPPVAYLEKEEQKQTEDNTNLLPANILTEELCFDKKQQPMTRNQGCLTQNQRIIQKTQHILSNNEGVASKNQETTLKQAENQLFNNQAELIYQNQPKFLEVQFNQPLENIQISAIEGRGNDQSVTTPFESVQLGNNFCEYSKVFQQSKVEAEAPIKDAFQKASRKDCFQKAVNEPKRKGLESDEELNNLDYRQSIKIDEQDDNNQSQQINQTRKIGGSNLQEKQAAVNQFEELQQNEGNAGSAEDSNRIYNCLEVSPDKLVTESYPKQSSSAFLQQTHKPNQNPTPLQPLISPHQLANQGKDIIQAQPRNIQVQQFKHQDLSSINQQDPQLFEKNVTERCKKLGTEGQAIEQQKEEFLKQDQKEALDQAQSRAVQQVKNQLELGLDKQAINNEFMGLSKDQGDQQGSNKANQQGRNDTVKQIEGQPVQQNTYEVVRQAHPEAGLSAKTVDSASPQPANQLFPGQALQINHDQLAPAQQLDLSNNPNRQTKNADLSDGKHDVLSAKGDLQFEQGGNKQEQGGPAQTEGASWAKDDMDMRQCQRTLKYERQQSQEAAYQNNQIGQPNGQTQQPPLTQADKLQDQMHNNKQDLLHNYQSAHPQPPHQQPHPQSLHQQSANTSPLPANISQVDIPDKMVQVQSSKNIQKQGSNIQSQQPAIRNQTNNQRQEGRGGEKVEAIGEMARDADNNKVDVEQAELNQKQNHYQNSPLKEPEVSHQLCNQTSQSKQSNQITQQHNQITQQHNIYTAQQQTNSISQPKINQITQQHHQSPQYDHQITHQRNHQITQQQHNQNITHQLITQQQHNQLITQQQHNQLITQQQHNQLITQQQHNQLITQQQHNHQIGYVPEQSNLPVQPLAQTAEQVQGQATTFQPTQQHTTPHNSQQAPLDQNMINNPKQQQMPQIDFQQASIQSTNTDKPDKPDKPEAEQQYPSKGYRNNEAQDASIQVKNANKQVKNSTANIQQYNSNVEEQNIKNQEERIRQERDINMDQNINIQEQNNHMEEQNNHFEEKQKIGAQQRVRIQQDETKTAEINPYQQQQPHTDHQLSTPTTDGVAKCQNTQLQQQANTQQTNNQQIAYKNNQQIAQQKVSNHTQQPILQHTQQPNSSHQPSTEQHIASPDNNQPNISSSKHLLNTLPNIQIQQQQTQIQSDNINIQEQNILEQPQQPQKQHNQDQSGNQQLTRHFEPSTPIQRHMPNKQDKHHLPQRPAQQQLTPQQITKQPNSHNSRKVGQQPNAVQITQQDEEAQPQLDIQAGNIQQQYKMQQPNKSSPNTQQREYPSNTTRAQPVVEPPEQTSNQYKYQQPNHQMVKQNGAKQDNSKISQDIGQLEQPSHQLPQQPQQSPVNPLQQKSSMPTSQLQPVLTNQPQPIANNQLQSIPIKQQQPIPTDQLQTIPNNQIQQILANQLDQIPTQPQPTLINQLQTIAANQQQTIPIAEIIQLDPTNNQRQPVGQHPSLHKTQPQSSHQPYSPNTQPTPQSSHTLQQQVYSTTRPQSGQKGCHPNTQQISDKQEKGDNQLLRDVQQLAQQDKLQGQLQGQKQDRTKYQLNKQVHQLKKQVHQPKKQQQIQLQLDSQQPIQKQTQQDLPQSSNQHSLGTANSQLTNPTKKQQIKQQTNQHMAARDGEENMAGQTAQQVDKQPSQKYFQQPSSQYQQSMRQDNKLVNQQQQYQHGQHSNQQTKKESQPLLQDSTWQHRNSSKQENSNAKYLREVSLQTDLLLQDYRQEEEPHQQTSSGREGQTFAEKREKKKSKLVFCEPEFATINSNRSQRQSSQSDKNSTSPFNHGSPFYSPFSNTSPVNKTTPFNKNTTFNSTNPFNDPHPNNAFNDTYPLTHFSTAMNGFNSNPPANKLKKASKGNNFRSSAGQVNSVQQKLFQRFHSFKQPSGFQQQSSDLKFQAANTLNSQQQTNKFKSPKNQRNYQTSNKDYIQQSYQKQPLRESGGLKQKKQPKSNQEPAQRLGQTSPNNRQSEQFQSSSFNAEQQQFRQEVRIVKSQLEHMPKIMRRMQYQKIPAIHVSSSQLSTPSQSKIQLIRKAITYLNGVVPDHSDSLINSNRTKICLFVNGEWTLFCSDSPNKEFNLVNLVGRYLKVESIFNCLRLMSGLPLRNLRDRNNKDDNKKLIKSIKYLVQKVEQESKYEQQRYAITKFTRDMHQVQRVRYFLDQNQRPKTVVECRKPKYPKKIETAPFNYQSATLSYENCNFQGQSISQFTQFYMMKNPYYFKLTVDKEITTFEMQLGKCVLYISQPFKYILYQEFSKNQYVLVKQTSEWLRFKNEKEFGRFLLIIEPEKRQQAQKTVVVSIGLQQNEGNIKRTKIIKHEDGSKAKGYNRGYQNKSSLYLPVERQIMAKKKQVNRK